MSSPYHHSTIAQSSDAHASYHSEDSLPKSKKPTPRIQVINDDSVGYMANIASNSVDLVFADPPYNLQLGKGLSRPDESEVKGVEEQWDQFASFEQYDTFTKHWLKETQRILKPDASLWVIGSYHNIFRLGKILQDMGFWIINDIIWVKSNPMPNFRGRRFTNAHETLLWCVPSRGARYRFNYRSMKTSNDDTQMRSDWHFPVCGGGERARLEDGSKAHPTQKPLALLRRVLLSCTKVDDLVVDPFLGSGTTAVAAKELGRRCVGIEQDRHYCTVARRRVLGAKRLTKDTLDCVEEPRQLPRIPFGALVSSGVIQPGTKLRSTCLEHTAQVQADGSLRMKEHQGSIHRVGAQASGRSSCNGWTYWTINGSSTAAHSEGGKLGKRHQAVPLSELRRKWLVDHSLSQN